MHPSTVDVTPEAPPDHTQLPDKDGAIVTNYQEHPQSTLLTSSLELRLSELFGEQFSIGCDSGIYWRHTQPVLNGCKAPDWFLVPGVPAMLEGVIRRSYVQWKEGVRPLLVIEYVSGDGSEERDQTPLTGKFWVYEQGIGAGYYAIFDRANNSAEVHQLHGRRFRQVEPNAAGRYPISELGIELGIWEGKYQNLEAPWLRTWDTQTGQLLPSAEERAESERRRAEAELAAREEAESLLDDARRIRDEETERAENERKRAELAELRVEDERKRADAASEQLELYKEKLRKAGIDPDAA